MIKAADDRFVADAVESLAPLGVRDGPLGDDVRVDHVAFGLALAGVDQNHVHDVIIPLRRAAVTVFRGFMGDLGF